MNNKIFYRTANTLRNRSDYVCCFTYNDILFHILHLGKPHYIIYRDEDLIDSIPNWCDVKIACEVNNFNNRNHISISVRKQFPEYGEFATDLQNIILDYIKEYQNVHRF